MGLTRWVIGAAWCCAASNAFAAADGPVEGFGSDMPLPLVTQQIVPTGVPVQIGAGVNKDATVNWRGGPSWQSALRDAVNPLGLEVTVNGKGVVVDVPPPPPPPPAPPPPPWKRVDHWVAEPGQTLAEVSRLWSARVGVTPVIYGVYRYRVDSRLVFDTDYEDAMIHLVESFSTAEPRPLLDIWSDGDNYTVQVTQGVAQ